MLSSAFGEAKRDFYYCLSVIWNDNRKEGGNRDGSNWEGGGSVKGKGGLLFIFFFSFTFFFIVDLYVVILKLS